MMLDRSQPLELPPDKKRDNMGVIEADVDRARGSQCRGPTL